MKNKLKKLVTVALACVMVLGTTISASASPRNWGYCPTCKGPVYFVTCSTCNHSYCGYCGYCPH